MTPLLGAAVALLLGLPFASLTNSTSPCVIELQCAECLPDNMPLVVSPRGAGGRVTLAEGERVTLSCGAGRFLREPARDTLLLRCADGLFRPPGADSPPLHLLDLGCQESVFEDVLHDVPECAPPLQGRAYVSRGGRGAAHLATLCYDADAGVARVLHAATAPQLELPPHEERSATLGLFGGFARAFDERTRLDAERLFASDERLTRRLRELVKHDRYPLAEHTLTSARLLAAEYFEEEHARVAEFASNRVAAWRSVAGGNLRLVQRDVARLARARRAGGEALGVWAGAHGVGRLARALWLGGAGRFPVPRYVWTAVAGAGRGVALVVLNEPLAALSALREAVFCRDECARVRWLRALAAHGAGARPAAGLVFCCSLPELARVVPDLPRVFNDTVELLV